MTSLENWDHSVTRETLLERGFPEFEAWQRRAIVGGATLDEGMRGVFPEAGASMEDWIALVAGLHADWTRTTPAAEGWVIPMAFMFTFGVWLGQLGLAKIPGAKG